MTIQRQAVLGPTWRRTQRVLIIDDDSVYRATLTGLFTNWQWDVFEASDALSPAHGLCATLRIRG